MTITWADVAMEIVTALRPQLPFAAALFLLWVLIRITDQSVKSTISDIFREFVESGSSAKKLNALGGLVMLAVIVFLFFGGLAHVAAPTDAHALSDYGRGIYAFVASSVGAYFILCVFVTKHQR